MSGAFSEEEDTVRRGREALEGYILDVLFNPASREGTRFRGEFLAWRDPVARDALKASLLAAASSWSPASPGWRRIDVDGDTAYAGSLGELTATIRFPVGALPAIELDLD